MTPENSEQPRETRAGVWLDESAEVTPEHFDAVLKDQRAKVSSPELASLAAKYVNIDTVELMDLDRTAAFELCMDVRSLAASVLAQAEGNPRK